MSQQTKTFALKRRWSAFNDPSPETPEKKIFKSLPGKFPHTTISARNTSNNHQETLPRHKSEATKVKSIKKSKDVAASSPQKSDEQKVISNEQYNSVSAPLSQKSEATKVEPKEQSVVAAPLPQKSEEPKVTSNEQYNDVADSSPQSRLLQRRILVAKRALESIKRSFFQRFEQGDLLGVGSFGKVYAGIRKKDQLPVAIKYIPKRYARNIEVGPNRRSIPAEVYFQRQLDHPHIIKLIEHHYFDGNHVLVTERPRQCTDLFEYLTLHDNNSVDETEAKTIFRQVLNAVEYLERRGILHNDLKPENVLLDLSDDAKIKLIDFGLAWKLTDEPIKTFSGTPEFCPPEYHITHQYDGRQATVWSLGCFLFDMLTGNPPFVNARQAASVALNIPESLSQDARGFLGIMLETRPWIRASLGSLKEHSWLKTS